MNFIKGKITKEFTLEEVNALNDLIKRDTPRAIKAEEYTNNDGETKTYYYCSVCDTFLGADKVKLFCPGCGQKQDTQIIDF